MSKMDRELEILGLEPSASASDVQDAFDDLLTVWDPDEFQNNPRLHSRAKKQMKEIHVAYGTLFGNKCPGCGTSNFYSANNCVACHQHFGLIPGPEDEPIALAANLEMSSSKEEPTRLYTSPPESRSGERKSGTVAVAYFWVGYVLLGLLGLMFAGTVVQFLHNYVGFFAYILWIFAVPLLIPAIIVFPWFDAWVMRDSVDPIILYLWIASVLWYIGFLFGGSRSKS